MANKLRGEMRLATIDDSGIEYTLKLTVNATCELEERSGKTFDEITEQLSRGKVTALRWLLWATLQTHHHDSCDTPEQAGEIMDACGGWQGFGLQMQEFMVLNAAPQGKDDEGQSRPPQAEAATGGVGSTSTPDVSASRKSSSGISASVSSGAKSPRRSSEPRTNGSGVSVTPG